MGRNANNKLDRNKPADGFYSKKLKHAERRQYEVKPRGHKCSQLYGRCMIPINQLENELVLRTINHDGESIEHQMIILKKLVVGESCETLRRQREFTQCLLDCLLEHHGTIYQGIFYGSSVNGLGLVDSDIDLRLRPLKLLSMTEMEPYRLEPGAVDEILRNIAFQTARCCFAKGIFVASSRCPITSLTFYCGHRFKPETLKESWSYDISLTTSPFSAVNSIYLRSLCRMEPKFHHLAIVLKYWSKVHGVVSKGLLSSYALINMLIFFCQNLEVPLLPTVNEMRHEYLRINDSRIREDQEKLGLMETNAPKPLEPAITKSEWQCLFDIDSPELSSKNREPMCILLLKFFEFYLKFPYAKNILSTNTGNIISSEEFPKTSLWNNNFKLKPFLNIQDPFDLSHNLTSGMTGRHLMLMLHTMRCSYERLASEIERNFMPPAREKKVGAMETPEPSDGHRSRKLSSESSSGHGSSRNWGLSVIFEPLTGKDKELFLA